MPKYEYEYVEVLNKDEREEQDVIDEMSKNGWEYDDTINVMDTKRTLVFRRERQS